MFSVVDFWTPLNSQAIEREEWRKRRGGLDSSNLFCWVSMATGYDCLCAALNKGVFHHTRTLAFTHTILQTFSLSGLFNFICLTTSIQFVHICKLTHFHSSFVLWTLYQLTRPLLASLSLCLAFSQSLINISNFGRSNYFEISTLLRPQASPVLFLPRLLSLSPGSQH